MSNNEIITLQIGHFSNFVGSHLWNLRTDSMTSESFDESSTNKPDSSVYFHEQNSTTYKPRCVMIDLDENVGSAFNVDPDSGPVSSSIWNGNITKPSHNANYSYFGWSNILKESLHRKSLCSLPVWSNSQNFDSFYKGCVGRDQSDGIPEAFLEEVLERVRYFAEACDYLSSVTCLADLQEGFGGLSSSIVDRIAQDYGRSMSIPIFAFTETPLEGTRPFLNNSDSSGKSSLQLMNVPLSYNRLLEHAQMFIPIEANLSVAKLTGTTPVDYRSASLVLALAIESSSGFHLSSDRRMSVKAWMSEATHMGRYPVCALESYLHDIKGLFSDGSGDSVERDPEADVLATFLDFDCFHSEDVRQYNHEKKIASQRQLTNINPFTSSFSAVNNGAWAVESSIADNEYQYVRPYTNSLNVQGDFSSGFSEQLFERCFNSPYLISGVSRSALPHYIDLGGVRKSNTPILSDQSEEKEYFEVPSIGAVGCNGLTGRHLENLTASWSSGTKVIAAQLEKVGMNQEERAELTEHLLSIAQLYSS